MDKSGKPAPPTMSPRIWTTLRNGEAARCFAWIAIQQIVVAASTYLLVLSARHATAGALDEAAACALAFALLLVLVYLPNTASVYYLQRWRLASLERFMTEFVRLNRGKTTLRHAEVRRHHEAALTNEAPVLFEQVTLLRYELASTVLSALLNVAVIGFVVAPGILLWYAAAGVLLAVSSRLSQQRIKAVAEGMQSHRKQLSGIILGAWENVFAGNPPNLHAWQGKFDAGLRELRHAALRYDLTRSVISGITVSSALVLIAIGNAWYFLENRYDIVSVTALLVTLPRQLQTIQHVFGFFNVLISYKGVRQQFEGLGRLLDLGSRADESLQYVDLSRIHVQVGGARVDVRTPHDFVALLKDRRGVRVTLRAPNGAGKSTLVAYAAEQLHPGRVFVPSYTTELEFPDESFHGLSDGRRAMAMLEALGNQSDGEFILIDEWDANLDPDNVAIIDQRIEDWVTAGRTVVEIRHRA